MTTAHRPTFDSAKGKNSQSSGTILHTRSLPAHTKLKYRQRGQGGLAGLLEQDSTENSGTLTESAEEKRAHLRAQLLQREENHNEKRLTDKRRLPSTSQDDNDDEVESGKEESGTVLKRARLEDLVNTIDADDDSSSSENEANYDASSKAKHSTAGAATADADAASDDDSETGSESESESEDEDELQRELEKIRQERAEQKARDEAREREREQEAREKEIAYGNPLLNNNGNSKGGAIHNSSSRRKWNDDVVFKNQAKGVDDKKDNGFINDMIRSDFHRKFMNKYIK